ncbi:MAG TPA: iron uptake porin [Stenomitos sp.]
MSTLFWKILRLSPVVLGASLFFSGSAYAQESASEQTVGKSIEVTVASSTELPQTPAIASPTIAFQNSSKPTVATSTDQAARPEISVEASTQLPEIIQTQPSISPLTSTDPSANLNRADSTLAQQVNTSDKTTPESGEVLQQIQEYQENNGSADSIDQVTNVTQLSDVRPTDWAYEALRSLVERYGCIAGYPDGTFRGNRAMTRYEFAAGLNACLQQIERLVGGKEGFATKSDLETLQRLVDEFRSELTALGTRVDQLEGRVGFLEDHQFSTTTKLRGEVIFAISDLFGDQAAGRRAFPGDRDYARDETVFQDRVRLAFDTSFTGKDLLRTRLQAGNFTEFGPLRSSTPAAPGTNITREGRFGFTADTGNDIAIDRLFYRFPLGNYGQAYLLASGIPFEDIVDVLNPGLDSGGTGALSRFGRFSPIYRMGGQGTGAAITLGGGKRPLRFDAVYSTNEGNNPDEGAGLFDGNYSALAQLSFKPFDAFKIAATYVNSYTGSGTGLNHGTGSIASNLQVAGRPVVGNSYGLEASFAFSPQLILSGWGAYTAARVIGVGDADVWTYGGTLSINDFGKKGSTLGFVVGMEPKLTGTSSAALASRISGLQAIDVGRRSDRDTSLHLEGFYKFRLSPNILITPGVIWLTAPGHDSRNDDIFIGTLRTTFTF